MLSILEIVNLLFEMNVEYVLIYNGPNLPEWAATLDKGLLWASPTWKLKQFVV